METEFNIIPESSKVIVGFSESVKLIVPVPLDSTLFKIPSLSISKSKLSTIPSSS